MGKAFTSRLAVAGGVSSGRLAGKDLAAPHRGVRVPADHPKTLQATCLAVLLVAPRHGFICGPTAAELHGIPLPPRLMHPRAMLTVAVPAPERAIRRAGVRGRRLKIEDTEIVMANGVRVTSPARTWCDLANDLSLPELVAAGDFLIRRRHVVVTRAQLEAAVAAYPSGRGHGLLRRAVALLDERSESPKESELRVVVIIGGLPAPEANVEIFDENGRFIARVDLLIREFGEVLEYHGDHHRTDRKQWRRDRTREAELEAVGLHVTEVTDDDLNPPDAMLERLRTILRRRGWTG